MFFSVSCKGTEIINMLQVFLPKDLAAPPVMWAKSADGCISIQDWAVTEPLVPSLIDKQT